MLVEVRIPVLAAGTGYAFEEVSNRRGDFALALVAVLVGVSGERINAAALSCAGVSDRALRLDAAERLLVGQVPSEALFTRAAAVGALTDVSEDQHADREYRCDVIRTLTSRALARAVARAGVRA
jgi:carbon-monoxide dehydrogenase medium subunit